MLNCNILCLIINEHNHNFQIGYAFLINSFIKNCFESKKNKRLQAVFILFAALNILSLQFYIRFLNYKTYIFFKT